MGSVTVGVDLGGTKIYAVALEDDVVVGDAKTKTPAQRGPLAVVDAIAAVVESLGVGRPDVVGVGAPGVVDSSSGVIRKAPNLRGWVEPFPLAETLSEALAGTPVTVENDVNACTIAEHRLGAAQGASDVLGVFVGTGVGSALVMGGRLRRGPSGSAGELGHVVVRSGGRVCGCGGRGHLEAYAGRAGMERRARQLEARGRDTLLVDLARTKNMTSSVFGRALARGDQVAHQLIERAVDTLGLAIANAVVLLDVPLVVVGGGLVDRLGDGFVERIGQATLGYMPPGQSGSFRVIPAQLGEQGGALGAGLLARAAVAKGSRRPAAVTT